DVHRPGRPARTGWPVRPPGPAPRTTPSSDHRRPLRLPGECEIVASTRCPSSWLNVILEKSHSSTTTGHFAFTTHPHPFHIGGSRLSESNQPASPYQGTCTRHSVTLGATPP